MERLEYLLFLIWSNKSVYLMSQITHNIGKDVLHKTLINNSV